MRRAFVLIFVVLFIFAVQGYPAAKERKVVPKTKVAASSKIALVIGNGDYKTSPLKNPVNDAKDIANKLRGLGFEVIERNNLHTKQIGGTLREFRSKLSPGAVALVFYAGHGLQIKGINYLPAVDADINSEEDVPNQSLGVNQIMDVLDDARTRLNLVFLDACRNNPYASRSFRSADRGLARISAPSGTLISYATKPGSVAADGDGRNGLYTSKLLKQMESNIQIELSLKQVVTEVKTASQGKQEPWMEGSIEGDFCFAGCLASAGLAVVEESLSQAEEITTGKLTIKSPAAGAQVFIDGNKAGTAPVTKTLSPGNYNIELRKEGYKAATETVRVERGKEKTVSILMEKSTGSIRVTSNPAGGKVYIDGAYTDTAPNTITDLKAGTYKIKVTKDGYSEWSGNVSVGEGEEAEITASLEAAKKPASAASITGRQTDPTTGMEFVSVKGGCYQMGDPFGDGGADEKPVHEVCVDDFYIGKYEVTVGEFRKFVNEAGYSTEAENGDGCYGWTGSKWEKNSSYNWKNLGFSQDDRHPVACVSWNDARAYAEWQNRKSGKAYRLPTEAEWEYAARSGGKSEKYAGGNDIDSVAWYYGNSGKHTHPAGEKQPNGLGIYDMSGNVWEWVQDWYKEDYYKSSPKDNPKGPGSEQNKVLRGGSWDSIPGIARAAGRGWFEPAFRSLYAGFRLAAPAQ